LPTLFGPSACRGCDHIAAIDNVTRKLNADRQAPDQHWLMFALGHSTIVVPGVGWHSGHGNGFGRGIGGVEGNWRPDRDDCFHTVLFAIATMNLFVLAIDSAGRFSVYAGESLAQKTRSTG